MTKNRWHTRLVRCMAFALIAWSVLQPVGDVQALDFVFEYDDPQGFGFYHPAFGESRRAALEAAGSFWGRVIRSSYVGEQIVVRAKFDPLDPGTIAQAKPHYFYSDFGTASSQFQANTNYPKALANHLAGRDLAPERHEIDVTVNESDAGVYYGLDGMPLPGEIDFVTVAAHEIGHGLGFFDSFQEDGDYGILGDGEHYDPGPACGGCLPTPYDRFLTLGTSGTTLLSLPSDDARESALTSNNVFWNGPNGIAGDGGTAPKINARAPFDAGSSISHLDQSMDIGVRPVLMAPSYPGVRQSPSAVERGIMRDLGWSIAVTSSQINWTGLGTDDAATTLANWSPAVPLPGDSVVFGPSPRTDVDMNLDLGSLEEISFPSSAPAYALRFRARTDLNITGAGVANASSAVQKIYLESSIRDDPTASHVAAKLTFLSNAATMTNATAGETEYWLSGGGTTIGGIAPPHGTQFLDRHPGAAIEFRNSSNGGTGMFEIEGGGGDGAPGATVTFRDTSNAGSAEYRNRGGLVGVSLPTGFFAGGFGGETRFENSSDAGSATFHNYGQAEHRFGSAGYTTFMDNTNAGPTEIVHGTFHNHGATIFNGQGGVTRFFETSTAGAARIFNHADGANGGGAALTLFADSSNAGTALIENEGSSSQQKAPGRTEFRGNSSADRARINNRGFITVGDAAGRTLFYDDSTAANATLRTFNGLSDHGRIEFRDRSTAADANIFLEMDPAILGSRGGYLMFYGDSTAARSNITLRAGNSGSGGIQLYDSATVADAQIIAEDNGGPITFYGTSSAGDPPGADTPAWANFTLGRGNIVLFRDQSTADDAHFSLEDRAQIFFQDNSSAGHAQFAAAGGSVYTASPGATISFNSNSTADHATILVTGATAPLASPAAVRFINGSHAGHSTLIANGGTGGGAGATITFTSGAKGDTARLVANAGGTFDFAQEFSGGTTTVGSINGAGTFYLRGTELVVGTRDEDSTVTGQIVDTLVHPTYAGGRLTKVGARTLTLAGVNAYSGLTTVSAGTLRLTGSIAGDVDVSAGARFEQGGPIAGDLNVAPGGVWAPGSSPGTATLAGLAMGAGSILDFEIGPTRDHIVLTNNGSVSLDGILNISFIDGFIPTLGQTFPLFEGSIGSIAGAFDAVLAPVINGMTLNVVQTASSVALQAGPPINLPGDFNGDGSVNSADFTHWKTGFGAAADATHAQGDADNDADVDGFDFLVWQRQLGIAPAMTAATPAIPEPATCVLLALGLSSLITRRCCAKRRR